MNWSDRITPLLTIMVRYAISGSGLVGLLLARGVVQTDVDIVHDQLTMLIVSAIMFFAPQAYAMIKRPSFRAMIAARFIDRHIEKDDKVTIKTPAGKPDLELPAVKP